MSRASRARNDPAGAGVLGEASSLPPPFAIRTGSAGGAARSGAVPSLVGAFPGTSPRSTAAPSMVARVAARLRLVASMPRAPFLLFPLPHPFRRAASRVGCLITSIAGREYREKANLSNPARSRPVGGRLCRSCAYPGVYGLCGLCSRSRFDSQTPFADCLLFARSPGRNQLTRPGRRPGLSFPVFPHVPGPPVLPDTAPTGRRTPPPLGFRPGQRVSPRRTTT
jgi:hypothetical protein